MGHFAHTRDFRGYFAPLPAVNPQYPGKPLFRIAQDPAILPHRDPRKPQFNEHPVRPQHALFSAFFVAEHISGQQNRLPPGVETADGPIDLVEYGRRGEHDGHYTFSGDRDRIHESIDRSAPAGAAARRTRVRLLLTSRDATRRAATVRDCRAGPTGFPVRPINFRGLKHDRRSVRRARRARSRLPGAPGLERLVDCSEPLVAIASRQRFSLRPALSRIPSRRAGLRFERRPSRQSRLKRPPSISRALLYQVSQLDRPAPTV